MMAHVVAATYRQKSMNSWATTVPMNPNPIYVTGSGLRGMFEYFAVDATETTILLFKGYDDIAGQCVRNLYTLAEAAETFGPVARRLA